MTLNEAFKKYGLEVEYMNCSKCNKRLKTTEVKVYPSGVNLKCPPCYNCGTKDTPEHGVCTSPEMNAFFSECFLGSKKVTS